MAKIPVYDIPQVEPKMPNVNLPSQAVRSGLEDLGAGITDLANKIKQKEQEADYLKTEEETNYARAEAQKLMAEVEAKKGNQILEPDPNGDDLNIPLKESLLKRYDENIDFQMAEIPDRQKERFRVNTERLRTELEYKIDNHINTESGKVANEGYNKIDATEAGHILNFGVTPDGQPDGPVIAQANERRKNNARQAAIANGTDPQIAVQAVDADTKRLVLDALINRDSPALETYFNTVKGELAEKDRLRFEKIVADKAGYYQARQNVPLLIEKYAIPGTNTFDINALMLDVYSRPGLSKRDIEEHKSLATSMQNLIEKNNAVRIEAYANTIIGAYAETGSAAVALNRPELTELRKISEAKAFELRNALFAWEAQAQAEKMGIKDPNRWMSQNAAFWAATADQNRLQNMTAQEIWDPNLMIALGQKNHADLVERWKLLRTPEGQRKFTDVALKSEELTDVFTAAGLGIKPNGKTKQQEWLTKKAKLRELIENDIRQLQTKSPQHVATEPERNEIYKRWTNKIRISKDKSWWWPFEGTEEVYAYQKPEIARQMQAQAQAPNIQISETAIQDLDSAMVQQGILPALKPGEKMSAERRQQVQQYLMKQTPQPVGATALKAAQEKASVSVPGPVNPVPTPKPTQPQAPPRVQGGAEKAIREEGAKIWTGIKSAPFLFTKQLAKLVGVKFTDQNKRDYETAIKEMTAAGVFQPGQKLNDNDWNDIKAYLANRKGKK